MVCLEQKMINYTAIPIHTNVEKHKQKMLKSVQQGFICKKANFHHHRDLFFKKFNRIEQSTNSNIMSVRRNYSTSEQGKWFEPCTSDGSHVATPITVYNSLSKSKVPFSIVNRKNEGKIEQFPAIYWYSCGPTVYDASHLGHARNYVSLDIIYRILTNYFSYPIFYVMGITDVDDKILKRASEVGKSPSEISIKYEHDFITDMKRLNVIQPAVYTRVTEHIEEIKLFIEEVEKNGFMYVTSNGGVYFDSKKFESENHIYGKLAPNTNQEETIQQEHIEHKDEKKDPRDFALWKFTSKEYLGWESKWGFGRPGWHIECSAMIDSIFTNSDIENNATIDIHSGGIDLAFPHHNNEIAQSEACHHSKFSWLSRTNWCNFFMHVGHLHIHGLKMSKSLKNFITIRDFLEKYTADQFRLFCLLHQYNQTVDYSEDAMDIAIKYEKRVQDFLHNAAFYRHECEENINRPRKWNKELREYSQKVLEVKKTIHEAICDDFNTPLVLDQISTMINMTNSLFFSNTKTPIMALDILENTSQFIIGVLHIFGLKLGLTAKQEFTGECEADEEITKQPFASKVIGTFVDFRSSIRKEALASKQTAILQIIDELRDKKLKELGIRIDDRSSEKSMWRYDATVKNEAETDTTETNHLEKLAQKKQEMEFKLSISLENYFKEMPQHKDKNYSQYNEHGIPTHDGEGHPLSKSAIKKLTKELEKHKELLEKHKTQ